MSFFCRVSRSRLYIHVDFLHLPACHVCIDHGTFSMLRTGRYIYIDLLVHSVVMCGVAAAAAAAAD